MFLLMVMLDEFPSGFACSELMGEERIKFILKAVYKVREKV